MDCGAFQELPDGFIALVFRRAKNAVRSGYPPSLKSAPALRSLPSVALSSAAAKALKLYHNSLLKGRGCDLIQAIFRGLFNYTRQSLTVVCDIKVFDNRLRLLHVPSRQERGGGSRAPALRLGCISIICGPNRLALAKRIGPYGWFPY